MRALLFSIAVALGIGSCGTPADHPEEPIWGKQPCGHCAMLLTELAHGAQLVTQAGDRLFFDDLGCMAAWENEHTGQTQHHWVRRNDAPGWLVADTATYQRAPHTPMDFGFVALPTGGEVRWPTVVAAVRQKLAK